MSTKLTLAIAAVFIGIALWLQESEADACEAAGGTPIRNAIGEYSDCLPK